MKDHQRKKRAVVPILGNVVLILVGIGTAMGLAEMLLRAFPNWVPPQVRVNPPARRVKAFIDETYDLRQSDGDLFHHMLRDIVPLSPDQDQVVAHVHMVTDANGFRNSPPEKATYGIVALGDSFTRASGVAVPWPQNLAGHTGMDVLNLGDVGFGPQDELKVFQQYGLEKQPQWVMIAYFEGNDLYDAAAYEQANPFILFRFGRYILGKSVGAWQQRDSSTTNATAILNYRYPITVPINHKKLELVFFPSYISWLALSREEIAASQNYLQVRETILQMQEASELAGARFLFIYLPSKSHVYLPFIEDAETNDLIFIDVPRLALDKEGFIQFTSEKTTPELTRQYMDGQAHLMAEFAAEHNILFLDLTPTFQEAASKGVELYYPFDTHWNQLGHDLAATTIYNFIKEMLADTANNTPGH